jgi:hypothetical protein
VVLAERELQMRAFDVDRNVFEFAHRIVGLLVGGHRKVSQSLERLLIAETVLDFYSGWNLALVGQHGDLRPTGSIPVAGAPVQRFPE